jgi:hypothetical protein
MCMYLCVYVCIYVYITKVHALHDAHAYKTIQNPDTNTKMCTWNIYICVCVCVCVRIWTNRKKSIHVSSQSILINILTWKICTKQPNGCTPIISQSLYIAPISGSGARSRRLVPVDCDIQYCVCVCVFVCYICMHTWYIAPIRDKLTFNVCIRIDFRCAYMY